jgi:probable phosphoglycerate mutase
VTLLLLVRHALTEATGRRLSGNAPGHHLSDAGRAQAEALAERLGPLRLAAVYASPLERCMETAHAVTDPRGIRIRPEPDLREVEYGRWTGRPLAQLMRTALWKRLQQSPSGIRFPQGESLAEVQLRAVRALDAIAARHPRGIVAAVTHADVIRLSLAHYSGIHVDLYQRLIVSPASVTAIALGDRVPRIVRTNDTGSLDDLRVRAGRPVASAPSRART